MAEIRYRKRVCQVKSAVTSPWLDSAGKERFARLGRGINATKSCYQRVELDDFDRFLLDW